MTTFLPQDAQEPKSKSNYTMPLAEGRHKLRVISSAIVGYEGWQDDGQKRTPIRWKVGEQPEYGPDGKETKYFWAFLVWNYATERVQIMNITQKKIRNQIKALLDDEAWGSPLEYDIVITREGKDINDTVYTVMPNPKTALNPFISQQMREKNIDLNVWMRGGDPFEPKNASLGGRIDQMPVSTPFDDSDAPSEPQQPTTSEMAGDDVQPAEGIPASSPIAQMRQGFAAHKAQQGYGQLP